MAFANGSWSPWMSPVQGDFGFSEKVVPKEGQLDDNLKELRNLQGWGTGLPIQGKKEKEDEKETNFFDFTEFSNCLKPENVKLTNGAEGHRHHHRKSSGIYKDDEPQVAVSSCFFKEKPQVAATSSCVFKDKAQVAATSSLISNILGGKKANNREDAVDFARRNGIEECPKPALFYRMRKGKYRKEF